MPEVATKPRKPRRKRCDMCKSLYAPGSSWLKGLCCDCCKGLGGGEHSARIIQTETRAMASGRRFK